MPDLYHLNRSIQPLHVFAAVCVCAHPIFLHLQAVHAEDLDRDGQCGTLCHKVPVHIQCTHLQKLVINIDDVTFVDFFKFDWSLGLGPIYCTPLCLTMVSFKIILKLVLHFDWQKGAAVLDPNDIDVFDILI